MLTKSSFDLILKPLGVKTMGILSDKIGTIKGQNRSKVEVVLCGSRRLPGGPRIKLTDAPCLPG